MLILVSIFGKVDTPSIKREKLGQILQEELKLEQCKIVLHENLNKNQFLT